MCLSLPSSHRRPAACLFVPARPDCLSSRSHLYEPEPPLADCHIQLFPLSSPSLSSCVVVCRVVGLSHSRLASHFLLADDVSSFGHTGSSVAHIAVGSLMSPCHSPPSRLSPITPLTRHHHNINCRFLEVISQLMCNPVSPPYRHPTLVTFPTHLPPALPLPPSAFISSGLSVALLLCLCRSDPSYLPSLPRSLGHISTLSSRILSEHFLSLGLAGSVTRLSILKPHNDTVFVWT